MIPQSASCVVVLVVLGFCSFCSAMLASPAPFTVYQPDGSPITLFLRGNEYMHMLEDTNGYTVVQSTPISTGFLTGILGTSDVANPTTQYVYATLDTQGNLAPTSHVVGTVDPAMVGIPPKVTPVWPTDMSHEVTPGVEPTFAVPAYGGPTSLGLRRRRDGDSHRQRRVTQSRGSVTNLVVMIRWSDSPFTVRSPQNNNTGLPTVQDLDTIFNGPTNSVRSVYQDCSYRSLTVKSIFTDWITVPFSEVQVAAGRGGLACCTLQPALAAALTLAQAKGINFAQLDANGDGDIDMISFVHSGYGAEWGGANYLNRVWSHKFYLPAPWVSTSGVAVTAYHISPAMWGTSGTSVGHIGVIAHEMGHFLGLPDLYDTDGGSFGAGLGSYSLMANSWGFDGTQNYPPIMDAWSKIQIGWMTPTLLTASGTYTIAAAATTSQVYKITHGFPAGEYLLIENRQPLGYDAKMPLGGLAIYHVDEKAGFNTQGWPGQAGWPQNGNHYRVALLQADGLFQLESTPYRGDSGDLWSVGGAKSLLSPTTVPNTNAYQGGAIRSTGIMINVLTPPGSSMKFQLTLPSLTPSATCLSSGVLCTTAPYTTVARVPCTAGRNCTVTACCRDQCTALADNAPCNDGKDATRGDRCVKGTCVGVSQVGCNVAGVQCPAGYILSTTAKCYPSITCTAAQCCAARPTTSVKPTTTARPTTTSKAPAARTTSSVKPTTTARPTTTSKAPVARTTTSVKPTTTARPITTTKAPTPTAKASTSTPKATTTARATPSPTPTQLSVSSIILSTPAIRTAAKTTVYQGAASVRIVNAKGQIVPGVTVTGMYTRNNGKISERVTGITAATGTTAGTITLRTKTTWATYDSTVQFCVSSVVKGTGFTYTPKLNKITCVKVAAVRTTG